MSTRVVYLVFLLSLAMVQVSFAGAVDVSVDIVVDKECEVWILFKNAGSTKIDKKDVPYNTFAKNAQGSWIKVYGSKTGMLLNPGNEMALPFKPQGYTLVGTRTFKANVDPQCAVLMEEDSACNNNEKVRTRKCIPRQKMRRKMN